MVAEPLSLDLEFVRAEQAGDPFAFRFAPQEYLMRLGGSGFDSARLGWDKELIADLAAVRLPGRDPAVLQRLGETLRRFLKSAGWDEYESQLAAAVRAERPVLLTISSAAAELYALPWELLTLKSTGQFVGELPGVLLRYEWPETRSASELTPRLAGERILFAWSAAAGAVPAAEQLQALTRACQAGGQPFDRERDVLERTSVSRLLATLATASQENRPIAVLHLLCHGSAIGSTFGLALDGDHPGDGPVVVDASRLRQLLAPHAAMLRLVVLSACDTGNGGALGSQLGSLAQTLHRAGVPAVVASRYPLSAAGSIRLTETLYTELLEKLASLENALVAVRTRLAQDVAELDWASLQLYARRADGDDTRPLTIRPYRGLLAFLPEHRRFFFGRDREIAELCDDLAALTAAGKPRLMVVAGASGTGKSSVVLAGAVPRLRASFPALRLAVMRPGSNPEAALERALASAPGSSGEPVPAPQPARPSAPLLLVVDQLEELLTHTEDPARRQSFVRRLWRLASAADSEVSILVTLRVDFIGRCGELSLDDSGPRLDVVAYDEAHRTFIAQLDQAALRQAIETPAHTVGLRLEEGLCQRMISEVDGQPGALPLLEDTLDLLWQRRRGRTLTQAAYDEVGGVTGALHRRADSLIEALGPAEQLTARRLLVRLVSIATDIELSTRRRVPLATLLPATADEASRFQRVLDTLVDARLLVRDGQGATQMVEVAHEALIRKWSRLTDWVKADRQMLLELAELDVWVKQGRELHTLLVDDQLVHVKKLRQRYQEDFPPAAQELLDKSEAAVARQKQRTRRGVRLSIGAAVLFALLALYGWRQTSLAEQETYAARDAARMGAARALAADPATRAALLREFEQPDLTAVRGWVQGATEVLRDSARVETELPRLHVSLQVAAIAADCTQVATVTADGKAIQLWRGGQPAAKLIISNESARHPPVIHAMALDPAGQTLLTVDSDHTARLYQVDGSTPPAILTDKAEDIVSAAFSRDGKQIFLIDKNKRVQVWSRDGHDTLQLVERGSSESAPAFPSAAPGHHFTIAAQEGKMVRLWDENGSRLFLLRGAMYTRAVTLCADGQHLATVSDRGGMRRWRIGEPAMSGLVVLPVSSTEHAEHASFSPDDSRVLVWTAQSFHALLWHADGTGAPVPLSDGDREAWSPDGKKLAVFGYMRPLVLHQVDRGELLTTLTPAAAPDTSPKPEGAAKSRPTLERVTTVAFSADGQKLATLTDLGVTGSTTDADGKVSLTSDHGVTRLWNAASGQLLATLPARAKKDQSIVFSPDSQKLAITALDNSVRILNADGQGTQGVIPFKQEPLVAFRPDSKQLLTVYNSGPVQLYNLDGSLAAELAPPLREVDRLLMSEDGSHLVAIGPELRLLKLDGRTVTTNLIAQVDGRSLRKIALSQDGSRLIATAAAWPKEARVFHADGSEPLRLRGMAEDIHSVALSKDGKQAVTIGHRGAVWVWNLDLLATLQPENLRQGLWEASSSCPDGVRVEEFLSRPELTAKWDFDVCVTMLNCVEQDANLGLIKKDDARYQKCLAQFSSPAALLAARQSISGAVLTYHPLAAAVLHHALVGSACADLAWCADLAR